jgi:hypothetical protein
VTIAAVMQWLALAVLALSLRHAPMALWTAAVFVPPVSVILVAIENLPSFWFPLRQTPGKKPEPFEVLGHVMIQPVVKLVGFAAAAFGTLAMSAGAYFVFRQSAVAALVAAWLTLAAGGCGLVMLVSHSFDQFDVSRYIST